MDEGNNQRPPPQFNLVKIHENEVTTAGRITNKAFLVGAPPPATSPVIIFSVPFPFRVVKNIVNCLRVIY